MNGDATLSDLTDNTETHKVRALILEVDAGPHERTGCPVSVTVPWGSDALVQLTRPEVRRPLPCQAVTENGGVRVYWLIDRLKAGQQQIYRLSTGDRQRKRRARVRVDRLDPHRLHVIAANRQLAILQLGRQWPFAFWSPLRTTDGHQIAPTPGPPPTRPQDPTLPQGGLWVAPRDIPGMGASVEQVGPAEWQSGPVFAEVCVPQRWSMRNGDELGVIQRARFFDPRDGNYLVDIEVELVARCGPVLVSPDRFDGLLTLTVVPHLVGGTSRLGTPVGAASPEELERAVTPWCQLAGLSGSRWIGATLMLPLEYVRNAHWQLSPHRRQLSLWALDVGDSAGGIRLETGERAYFRCRLLVHRGHPDRVPIANYYADYVFPPAVRVVDVQ